MKHRNTACIAVGITTVLFSTAALADDLREAIDAQNRAFEAAMGAGDADAVGALYAADAVVIPPGADRAIGRPAITAFWKGGIAGGIKDVELRTETLASDGDLAVETGEVAIVDQEGHSTTARYVVVWKRTGGGWKLHRDIWNAR